MSTKIYDGHQIQLDTPTTITEFFDALREGITAEFTEGRDALIVALSRQAAGAGRSAATDSPFREAVEFLGADHHTLHDWSDGEGRSPIHMAEAILLATHRHPMRSALDLNFGVAIATDVTRPTSHALVWLFGRPEIYRKTLDSLVADPLNGFSEYAYWNNTDRPGGVSSSEWGRRQRSWSETFGYEPISARSLVWNVIGDAPATGSTSEGSAVG